MSWQSAYPVNMTFRFIWETTDIAFRVSLRNEETVGDVFHALSEIIPIRYERRDRDIYIRKQ